MRIGKVLDFSSFKRFIRPLETMVEEGQWDLTVQLTPSRRPGLKRLVVVFNIFINKLRVIFNKIAAAAVNLSKVIPDLASLAQNLESGAQDQVGQIKQISLATQHMAEMIREVNQYTTEAATFYREVINIMATLKDRAQDIEGIIRIVEQMAFRTRLLALNASVEAARAGEHGAGFAVVAQEIRQMADQTTDATTNIGNIMQLIQESLNQLASQLGQDQGDQTISQESSHHRLEQMALTGETQENKVNSLIDQVSADLSAIGAISHRQSENASHLSQLGLQVRRYCDDLLLSVGVFRLTAHQKARDVVEKISHHPDMQTRSRPQQEAFMRQVTKNYPFLELLYVTDARGMQITENIAHNGFQAAYGSSGLGKNWSQRPWFLEAIQREDTFISDIYRSAASDNFCFTVSTPLWDSDGHLLGILGADIHFADILKG